LKTALTAAKTTAKNTQRSTPAKTYNPGNTPYPDDKPQLSREYYSKISPKF